MPLINHEIAQKQSLHNDLLAESRENTFYFLTEIQTIMDKFTLVALFHTHQTNSSILAQGLPPLLKCWTRVHPISQEIKHCIGGLARNAF